MYQAPNDVKVRTIVYSLSLIGGVLIVFVGNHILRIHDPATMLLLFILNLYAAFAMSGTR